MTTLADLIEDILDDIVTAIEAEVAESGSTLSGVQAVVRGDRARPMPQLPSIWVVPQAAQFNQAEYGDAEAWSMPVSIAALVKDDEPDTGGRLAARLAAQARAAALVVRTAGVIDVRSETFDPAARSTERNRELFWCEATIRVTFTVEEEMT